MKKLIKEFKIVVENNTIDLPIYSDEEIKNLINKIGRKIHVDDCTNDFGFKVGIYNDILDLNKAAQTLQYLSDKYRLAVIKGMLTISDDVRAVEKALEGGSALTVEAKDIASAAAKVADNLGEEPENAEKWLLGLATVRELGDNQFLIWWND